MRPKLYVACLAAALTAMPLLPDTVPAQVGHDPLHSPYRTLRYSQFVGLTGGAFQGSGGALGVAPHHGKTIGLRYDFLANGTVTLGIAASYADLERLVVNPTKPIATAVSGPIKQTAGIGELILQFNVTGGKSWHRLAPFISGGMGFVLASRTPQDSSGFKFRTRFAVTPGIGTRVFLTDRLFLRLEARVPFWQLSYPASYRTVPSTDPTQPPVLVSPRKEWTTSGWFMVGLSYAFARPF